MKNRPVLFYLTTTLIFLAVMILLGSVLIPDMFSTDYNPPELPGETGAQDFKNENFSLINAANENIKEIINNIKKPNEFYMEATSKLHLTDGSILSFPSRRFEKTPYVRLELLTASNNIASYALFNDNYVYYWRPDDARTTKAKRGDFTPNNVQMLLSYEEIAAFENDKIVKCSLTTLNNKSVIYVESLEPQMNYMRKYWISPINGILIKSETYKANRLIYETNITKFELSTVSDANFRLPNGASIIS